MALVRGHGSGAGEPRVEVSRASRLPEGVPYDPDEVLAVPTHEVPASSRRKPKVQSDCTVSAQDGTASLEIRPDWNESSASGTADPSPDLPPGGVSRPGAPSALISSTELFPAKKPGKPLFQKGNPYAKLGGAAKKDTSKLLSECGIPDVAPFKKFKAIAQSFHRFHVQRLARDIGGGECGPAPALMVKFASFQAASAEYLYREAVNLLETPGPESLSKVTTLFESSSKLQNASRQNLLAAHELCAKEALSKRNRHPGRRSAIDEAFGEPKP